VGLVVFTASHRSLAAAPNDAPSHHRRPRFPWGTGRPAGWRPACPEAPTEGGRWAIDRLLWGSMGHRPRSFLRTRRAASHHRYSRFPPATGTPRRAAPARAGHDHEGKISYTRTFLTWSWTRAATTLRDGRCSTRRQYHPRLRFPSAPGVPSADLPPAHVSWSRRLL